MSLKERVKIFTKPGTSRLAMFLLLGYSAIPCADIYANGSGITHNRGRNMALEKVEGRVVDSKGDALIGVSVKVKGAARGVTTDINGRFQINVESLNAVLVFTYVGFNQKEVALKGSRTITVQLAESQSTLEEVAITGFGTKTKKTSLVSSVTTVNVAELKQPTSNLTNALQGKIAGVIAFQQSGEPGIGTDNSTFYIRGLSTFGSGKRDPLILIDGIESSVTDLGRMQPDDISDFSVLKDASASSIYGTRGANGVILINTKLGKEGVTKFYFRQENRLSGNTQNFQLADNITYMNLANEAYLTRTPLGIQPYSQNKINHTAAGDDPYLFPNNNWVDQLIKDYTYNQAYNLNISGGTPKGRYFISGTYNRDNGVLKVDKLNNFNSNIALNSYTVRSNIDLDITKTTTLIVRVAGVFDDYNGPIGTNNRSGGATTFDNALRANPVMFPAKYPSSMLPFIEHPLFGSATSLDLNNQTTNVLYVNPYAEMVKGYQTRKTSNIQPQVELKQNLEGITKGLSARAMAYLKRTSVVSLNRAYNPFYYNATITDTEGDFVVKVLNDGTAGSVGTAGTEYLNYTEGEKAVDSRIYVEGSINYSRLFKQKHSVGAMLNSFISSYEVANPGSLILSLPNKNTSLSGRLTYAYDDKYLFEFNFGYNGSERFGEDKRFGFFPSGGIGYRISEEKFFEPLKSVVSNLKLRATYGMVGNDQIGAADQRFLYLSNVNLNDGAYGASFGKNDGAAVYSRPGVSIQRYANNNIVWEESRMLNLGLDLGIKNNFELTVDAFTQQRSQILQPLSFIDNALGLMAIPLSNYGKAKSVGLDLAANYRKQFNKKFFAHVRGTFSFAASEFVTNDELSYTSDLAHLSRIGYPLSQQWGYVAERLFVDDEEVRNSPVQFGSSQVRGGDIKYRDINNDGVINTDDQVAIGYPTVPEINYGFGSTFNYKKFDFGFYFTGVARTSFFMDPAAISPFVINGGLTTGLLQRIADNHWSEDNRNLYALWPRLSTVAVGSNNQRSTWWMRDGSFLRLKNIDFGYNFNMLKQKRSAARIYFSATNLFVLSKFQIWDPEMGGNGLGYPVQSVYNLGISVNL